LKGKCVNIRLNRYIHENDWGRLSAFLDGKNTWCKDGAKPLKPEIPRIRELLGLDEESAPES